MTVRLFVEVPLKEGQILTLSDNAHHYLVHVMRADEGDNVLLFNGEDGEWRALIEKISKKETLLQVVENTRLQSEEKLSDVWLCFAPIKKDNMDFIIQKATELGVRVLQPVITRRTVVNRVNLDKIRLQAIEAAEQSERLSLPEIKELTSLDKLLLNIEKDRTLYYLDERGDGQDFVPLDKVAYLVGPEGGFDKSEIEKLRLFDAARPLHFGRRILRAETACLAVLSVHNHLTGWK